MQARSSGRVAKGPGDAFSRHGRMGWYLIIERRLVDMRIGVGLGHDRVLNGQARPVGWLPGPQPTFSRIRRL